MLLALLLVAEQLSGLAVDEMQSRAGGAGYALVVLPRILILVRRPQGLHVEARGRAPEGDQSVHDHILKPLRARQL